MSAVQLLLEFGLLIWAIIVLKRNGWKVNHPKLLWGMTVASLVANVALMLAFLPTPGFQTAMRDMGQGVLYGFLIFRVVEWAVIVHILTRLNLALGKHAIPGGFGLLRVERNPPRLILIGIGVGAVGFFLALVLNQLWVSVGILDKSIFTVLREAGVNWSVGIIGGLRNLVSEEVVTRLGVQTLLLYHLRHQRWGPMVAALASCLFFELWHNGLEDLYFLNFVAALPLAWSYNKYGYETAAVGHCIADWLAVIAVMLLAP